MPEHIYRIDTGTPQIDESAYIAPTAIVTGAVTMGPDSSLWHCAVLRADTTPITIGAGSNIQDGTTCHADPGFPLTVGERVAVGHNAILHGCTIEDDVLVGMGAIVMNGAVVGSGSIIGAGALVTQGTVIPANSMVLGSPGKVVRETTADERGGIDANWKGYVGRISTHRDAVRVDRSGNPT
ncbi:gamma carbonic anhydrase family protein [Cumulibacter soli]|uniref:gamma carbonic anhydrase family protein n=1 Tax=Cumulibacter soli TaxID=2546344 RepID=UPI001067E9E1|nr:gamma carbonic anhydrase family protein [Cumulibacter soli]